MSTIRRIKIRNEKKNITRAEKKQNETLRKKTDTSPLLLLLYLCGLNGLLMAANEVLLMPSAYFFLAAFLSSLISIFLWFILTRHNKLFTPIIIAGCVAAVMYSLINFRSLSLSFSGMSAEGNSISLPAAILIALILLLLVFTMEFVSRNHSLMFLICAAIIIFGSSAGINLSAVTVILIIIFQFGFMVLNMSQAPKRKRLIMNNHARISAICSVIATVLIIICFAPSFLISDIFEDDLYSQVYMADAFVQDIYKSLSEFNNNDIIDGQVSRGNLHQTGKKIFTVSTVNPLQQKIYLKGFIGREYYEDNWHEAFDGIWDSDGFTHPEKTSYKDDMYPSYQENLYSTSFNMMYFYREPFMNELVEKVKNQYFDNVEKAFNDTTNLKLISPLTLNANSENIITNYIYSRTLKGLDYYDVFIQHDGKIILSNPEKGNVETYTMPDGKTIPDFPELILNKDSTDIIQTIISGDVSYDTVEAGEGNTINIAPDDNSMQNVLIPYYSKYTTHEIYPYSNTINHAYTNLYRDSLSTDSSSASQTKIKTVYADFMEAYEEQIQEEYNYIPFEEMPRLTDLCSNTELDNINEITTFILYTLQTHANYSTTPGTVPYNKNTVEYFLFENHKGYCVHFATTAAMMYRLYGIPARYVTGYVVSPNDLHLMDGADPSVLKGAADYRYEGEITDRNAHAWVEIFLKDYGWVPVEVTPTSEGLMYAEYPGYDVEEMTSIMQKYGWEFTGTDHTGTNNRNQAGGDDEGLSTLQLTLICLLLAVIGVIAFIIVRRIYILRKQDIMNCPQIYHRLITALHCSGLLTALNGSEDYFSEVLKEAVPVLSTDDCIALVEILRNYHYSGEKVSPEETEKVRQLYLAASHYLYEHTVWYKKPVFRFIKALC